MRLFTHTDWDGQGECNPFIYTKCATKNEVVVRHRASPIWRNCPICHVFLPQAVFHPEIHAACGVVDANAITVKLSLKAFKVICTLRATRAETLKPTLPPHHLPMSLSPSFSLSSRSAQTYITCTRTHKHARPCAFRSGHSFLCTQK